MAEEIEVRLDPKVWFTEMDEDGKMQDGFGTEVAKTNLIIIQDLLHERMHGNPKSADEIVFKNN